jgi:hypothetical protein
MVAEGLVRKVYKACRHHEKVKEQFDGIDIAAQADDTSKDSLSMSFPKVFFASSSRSCANYLIHGFSQQVLIVLILLETVPSDSGWF